MRYSITLCVVLGLCACGDDDGGTDAGTDAGTDTGGTDADMDAEGQDAPIDADVETTEVMLRFLDSANDDAPLADVKVRSEANGVVAEAISGSDGIGTIAIPAAIGETATSTVALEGYVILTIYEGEITDEGTTEPLDVQLSPIVTEIENVQFTINATGIPEGGRICASLDNWSLCSEDPDQWRYMVPADRIGDSVNVFAIDDSDQAMDFAVVDIPEGETTVSVDFDGTFDADPERRTVTLELPTRMLFQEFDLDSVLVWQGWFGVADTERQQFWSTATNVQRVGSNLTADVAIVNPPAGIEFNYGSAFFTNLTGFAGFTNQLQPTDPGNTITVMDVAELDSGDRLDGAISFTAPTAPDGMEVEYNLALRNSARRFFWNIRTQGSTTITAPELPSEYDREVSFPFEGSMGSFLIQTFTRLMPDEEPGDGRAYFSSNSEAYPITF